MKKMFFAIASASLVFSSSSFAGDPKASPDIVGRNLSIWGLGAMGHVGMWSGSSVVEVLNKPVVVQANTLQSFKDSDKYWGAKYGIGAAKGSNIIAAGWGQRLYNPSYTTTTLWREGGVTQNTCAQYRYGRCIKLVSSKSTALFRCDTFVDFSFKKGSNAYLVNGGVILPRIVYNSMPSTR